MWTWTYLTINLWRNPFVIDWMFVSLQNSYVDTRIPNTMLEMGTLGGDPD